MSADESKRNRQAGAKRARQAAALSGKRPYAGGRVSERVRLVRQLMGEGWQAGDITRKLSADFKCDERTIQGYMQTVRNENLRTYEEIGKTHDYAAQVLGRIEASYAAAVKAKQFSAAARFLQQLMDLTGVSGPRKIELSGPAGAPIATQSTRVIDVTALSDEQLLALANVFDAPPPPVRLVANGTPDKGK